MGAFVRILQNFSEQQFLAPSAHFLEYLFVDASDLDRKLENNAILDVVTRRCSVKKDIL